ncbi:hypothetical protein AVEN_146231-1 [Araneus ventricosus]|uniref:Uncharacterized protein n=1 Tax=Araneus ventricosus TaxID=182803 RepID=A0A4Y2P0V0_ARAVE|nr:hypothetical protein AVEN_146231-1 [Araneus ventricosus]
MMARNFMTKGGVGVKIRAFRDRIHFDLLEYQENSDIDIDDSDANPYYLATDDGSDTDTIDKDYLLEVDTNNHLPSLILSSPPNPSILQNLQIMDCLIVPSVLKQVPAIVIHVIFMLSKILSRKVRETIKKTMIALYQRVNLKVLRVMSKIISLLAILAPQSEPSDCLSRGLDASLISASSCDFHS